jgi:hypothetical protein
LQQQLLSSLKVIKGKQQDILAWGLAGLEHVNDQHLFPMNPNDNSLKRHISQSKKQNTRFIHI